MRKLMLAGIGLLMLMGLVLACYPPSRPAVPSVEPVEVRRDAYDFMTRGIGTGTGCPVLNGDRAWQGGVWTSDHQFPRLYHFFADNVRGNFTESVLDDIALVDVVELMVDAPFFGENGGLYNMSSPTDNPFSYLRTANSKIKLMAYVPAYYWWDDTVARFGNTYHPVKVAVEDALDDANGAGGEWWMMDADGNRVAMFGDYMVNLTELENDADGSGDFYNDWLTAYLTGTNVYSKTYSGTRYWDGIRFDVADSVPHQYAGADWDADENGTSDRIQYGKPTMNDYITDGFTPVVDALVSDGAVVVGNGSWEQGNTWTSDPPYADNMQGAMDEDWPLLPWYDPTSCGTTTSSACGTIGGETMNATNLWSFHMARYAKWMDTATDAVYVNLFVDLSEADYFNSYIDDEWQARRFLLGSTLLDNGYATMQKGNGPLQWCDECGVVGGSTTKTLAATGWLGCPLEVATDTTHGYSLRAYIDAGQTFNLADYVWKREFTNGLVVVNPQTTAVTVDIGTGWQKINGTYDTTHNDGSAMSSGSLTIGPMDVYVLVRSGASTPTPTATPTTGPSPTPTPTSTATPTPPATATPGATPTAGAQPTATPGAIAWDFSTSNETGPAAVTPTPGAGTPVYDGDWPWRTTNSNTYAYNIVLTTTKTLDQFSYVYEDCNSDVGSCTIANTWNARAVATPVTVGRVKADLRLKPHSTFDFLWNNVLAARYWSSGNFDQEAVNYVWSVRQNGVGAVEFYCEACDAPKNTTLFTDTTGAAWHTFEVAWDVQQSQVSTVTMWIDTTPTPAYSQVFTPGSAHNWNGVTVGVYTVHINHDTDWKVYADDVNVCDQWACPTVTPESPPGGERYITEVLASEKGGNDCVDWNLRNGCGTNDEFVEIMAVSAIALDGWVLTVGECTYTLDADNITGPLKVIWADEFNTNSGAECDLPAIGTVTLTDDLGTTVDTRDYFTYTDGESWQADAWTAPSGSWSSGTPSPGTG